MASRRRAKEPRLVSNVEVLELVRARRALHGTYPKEDRDRHVELLFASLEANLLSRDAMGHPPDGLPSRDNFKRIRDRDAGRAQLSFADCSAFVQSIKHLALPPGVTLFKSELLQLINLRPTNLDVIKLIVPSREDLIQEEHYLSIQALIQELLLPEQGAAGKDDAGFAGEDDAAPEAEEMDAAAE